MSKKSLNIHKIIFNLLINLLCILLLTPNFAQATPHSSDGTLSNATLLTQTSAADSLDPQQYTDPYAVPANPNVQIAPDTRTINKSTAASHIGANRGNASFALRGQAHVRQHSSSDLFKSYGDLASAFDNILTIFKNTGRVKNIPNTDISQFVMLWRKIQFMALNDLYVYLTSVYSSFILQQSNTFNDYLTTEINSALNKKAIIVNHLINTIQAQMYHIGSSTCSTIPDHIKIKAGRVMLDKDTTVDPIYLLQDFSQPLFDGDMKTQDQINAHNFLTYAQQQYLNAIKAILNFFTQYTKYLTIPDTQNSNTTQFFGLAQNIANIMQQEDTYTQRVKSIQQMSVTTPDGTVDKNLYSNKLQQMRSLLKESETNSNLKPINPPLFYYDAGTLRAIKLLPALANDLPTNSQPLGWPTQLVVKASLSQDDPKSFAVDSQGLSLGYPIAEFHDANGNIVYDQTSAVKLYINIPSTGNPPIFQQEILKEPTWLNSKTGVINMLRACLGDYTQLIGQSILSTCTEQIFCKSLGTTCNNALSQCSDWWNQVGQLQQDYRNALTKGQLPALDTQTQTQAQPVTQPVTQTDPDDAFAGY